MTPIQALLVVAVSLVAIYGLLAAATYRRHRGTRLVMCPETRQPAAVTVDAVHAARAAGIAPPEFRLETCSRWPERGDCGRECLAQIEAAPEGCLVRAIVSHWYEHQRCAFCNKPFTGIEHAGHKTALLGPHGGTVEWASVRSERLPTVLRTHRPVCWNCHVAESFRRIHPELVIDRERPHRTTH